MTGKRLRTHTHMLHGIQEHWPKGLLALATLILITKNKNKQTNKTVEMKCLLLATPGSGDTCDCPELINE